MVPALSIAFLLLSTTVKSMEHQSEEEEDYLSKSKQMRMKHHAEERSYAGDLCEGCESLVTKVKKKMGNDPSKAAIAKLVDKVCSEKNSESVEDACKKINENKDNLSDATAKGKDPKSACKQVKLCGKKPPRRLWTLQMK